MLTTCSKVTRSLKCNRMILAALLSVALLIVPFTSFGALSIDGILDEPDWAGAQKFRDFVVIDPLSYDTPQVPTEARILSLPEGLAVAFICEHPSEETRTRTVTQRDAREFYSDSVSLLIDFDRSGKIAYEFSVSITGGYRDATISDYLNTFNYDWDGLWERAVNEEPERWTVEILLPWSIAPMRDVNGDTRLMGMSFQRVLYSRKETFAFPSASRDRTRFISEFAKVEVASHSAREFDVWPYVTVLSDLVNDSIKGKAGLDLFWKPSGRFQLIATVNPDFGQVESDDLVIDFSAIETFFSDKRPFFTENQSIFRVSVPPRNTFIYTRRIGGPSDDGGLASDIIAAGKIIGSAGQFDYGFLAAQEEDETGRSFYAGRIVYPAENWSVGALSTYTERPFLDRTAFVNALDYHVFLGDSLQIEGKFISTTIDSPTEDTSGYGIFTGINYDPSERLKIMIGMTRWDDTMNYNDMGYMDRNDLERIMINTRWLRTDFPEDSRSASVAWSFSFYPILQNTDGDKFPLNISLGRSEKMRSGADISVNVRYYGEGYDDLISRGNGLVRLDDRWNLDASYTSQRRGSWRQYYKMSVFQEGYSDWSAGLEAGLTWYYRDNLNVDFSLSPSWSRDWLIWLYDDLLASFYRRQVTGEIKAAWFPADRHEVQLRAQWFVINADAKQGYRIGEGGHLVPSNDQIDDFDAMEFGLQFRYRYEIAPLSDIYLVYSRGGREYVENTTRSTLELLSESSRLRDSDQILIKFRYRF